MKYLLLIALALPALAQAHCPFEVEVGEKTYCAYVTWMFTESKIRGEFEETDDPAPHLIPMREVPQKWRYSLATVATWEKGDPMHTIVQIPGFRVFPYMHMINGHHHSTGYEFAYEEELGMYVIRRVAFQKMPGCWSLRWTTAEGDQKSSSQFLEYVTQYMNIDDQEYDQLKTICAELGPDGNGSDGDDDHGHHHDH